MKRANWNRLAILFLALQLGACAQIKMSDPKPTPDNLVKLRTADFAPAAVSNFTLDPKKPAEIDKAIYMRGANSVSSPIDNSFAQYLKATLTAELSQAGLLDANSKIVISGVLTESNLDVAIGTGKGEIGAIFTVVRDGEKRFEKELHASGQWESSFIAAIAIPRATGEYEGLYRKLVATLIDDPDFRSAVKK